jgi:prepilin-type N-terminal cleavage/methylation domain-containing protein
MKSLDNNNLKIDGYSLLEVSIALLVLSIGVLDIAKMQTTALIRNYNTYLYSVATEQIGSLFERLQVGQIALELPLWRQNVASALPQGYGLYDPKAITVCWFDRFTHTTRCLRGP